MLVLPLFFVFFQASQADKLDDLRAYLRITEIMVNPTGTSDDEEAQGFSRSDFQYIEIQNIATNVTLKLNNVELVDGVKYEFPKMDLEPQDYVIVCSKKKAFKYRYKSVSRVDGIVHASAIIGNWDGKLKQEGEKIELAFKKDTIQSFTYQNWYPQIERRSIALAIINASAPLDTWNQKDAWYVTPEGGEPGFDGPGSLLVEFSKKPNEVLFQATFNLELKYVGARPGTLADIYYNFQRVIPTFQNEVYESPIAISKTVMVRARAYVPSLGVWSPTFSQTFILTKSNINTFDMRNNVSVVLVETFGANLQTGRTSINEFVFIAVVTRPTGAGTIDNQYITFTSMATMRVRGSSSSGLPKKQYAINLVNEDGRNRKHSPFPEFPEESDWIQYTTILFDRCHLRSVHIFDLYRNKLGRWAPGFRANEMFMIGQGDPSGTVPFDVTSPSHFYGIYWWLESIKDGKDRVDIAKMLPGDNYPPENSGGYIFKVDRVSPVINDGFTAGAQNWVYTVPSITHITPQQKTYLTLYINDLQVEIDTATGVTPKYHDFLDVQQSIEYHFMEAVYTQNPDALVLSTFLHKEREGLMTWGPVWDFDRTMGSDDDARSVPTSGHGANFFTFGLWGRLFKDPQFHRRYTENYHRMRSTWFTPANITAYITRLARILEPVSARNYARWGYGPNNGGTTYMDEVNQLINWAHQRIAWLDNTMCFTRAPPCSDNTYCTSSICRADNGACSNTPNECLFPECGPVGSNGNTCNDTNACTTNDKCSNGNCIGTPIVCNDNIACTEDSCDPVKGCVFDPKNSRCEDKHECTKNKCTAKGCVVEFDHDKCDDNNKCTKDTCTINGCVFTPITCNDNISCTEDYCDPEEGCYFQGNDNRCKTGGCTQDTCHKKKGCVQEITKSSNTSCDDHIDCTLDYCTLTGCKHVPRHEMCEDKVHCTENTCVVGTGCVFVPKNNLCDDQVACTDDVCHPHFGCEFFPNNNNCPAYINCTKNVCHSTDGCQYFPDNTTCGWIDNDPCTLKECHLDMGCQIVYGVDFCKVPVPVPVPKHKPVEEQAIPDDLTLSKGALAGIIIGSIVGGVLLGAIVFAFLCGSSASTISGAGDMYTQM